MKGELSAEKEFLRQVSAHLTCTRREKKEALSRVREILREIPEGEKQTLEQIIQLADTPEAAAKAVSPVHDPQYISKRKRIRIAVCAAFALIVAALLIAASILGRSLWTEKHKYDDCIVEITGPAIEGTAPPDFNNGAIEIYGD